MAQKTKAMVQPDYEIRTNDDETLDEVVATNAKSVHLEQMSRNQWWMGIQTKGDKHITVWFTTRGRGAKIHAFAELDGNEPSI